MTNLTHKCTLINNIILISLHYVVQKSIAADTESKKKIIVHYMFYSRKGTGEKTCLDKQSEKPFHRLYLGCHTLYHPSCCHPCTGHDNSYTLSLIL